MKIVIYGAGYLGRVLKEMLQKFYVKPLYFCQTYVDDIQDIDGIPIISFKELIRIINDDFLILIAVADKKESRKIKNSIINIMLDKVTIYECGSFLLENNHRDFEKRSFSCFVCNSNVAQWEEKGISSPLFKNHHVIGAGIRRCKCPICGSSDRSRWLFYVLGHYTNIFQSKCRVLHFAPEKEIAEHLQANPYCDYYSGDILFSRAMHVTDIENIQYRDNTFDYILATHVLEHVSDIGKALSEIKRVLKKNGMFIFSFPICTDQITIECSEKDSADDRLNKYGDPFHLRLFGMDYLNVLRDYDMEVKIYSPKDICTNKEIMQYRFIPDDIMLIYEKA